MKIILLTVILIILGIVLYMNKPKKEFMLKKCILLPCCVRAGRGDDETRIKWYTETIKKYLETTNLQIRVVESSGYEFPIEHERLKQFVFSSELDKSFGFPSRGESESIIKVNESGILDDLDIIVKITGKYYLPDIEEEINNIPENAGIMYQNIKEDPTKFIASEIFGFKRKYINDIFKSILECEDQSCYLALEHKIYNIHENLGCDFYTFKTLKIECTHEKCPFRSLTFVELKEL